MNGDPAEIIPEELQERADGHTDRNGSQPPTEEPPFLTDPHMARVAAAIAELNLRTQTVQAMTVVVVVSLVALVIELELLRRRLKT